MVMQIISNDGCIAGEMEEMGLSENNEQKKYRAKRKNRRDSIRMHKQSSKYEISKKQCKRVKKLMTIKCNNDKEYEHQREIEFIENKNNKTDKLVKEHKCSKCNGNHLTRWCNYPKNNKPSAFLIEPKLFS